MVHHYKKIFPTGPHVAAYNIVKDSLFAKRAQEAVCHPWLEYKQMPVVVAAGTLTRRKGFSDLLNAISILRRTRQVRLILLGEGHLRADLHQLSTVLGIADVVDMPGNVLNPLPYFSRSDVFVLSSYSEGMPNVLVEAMSCGCTSVATDCPSGPRELLQDGKYGYLVPMHDPASMAQAIEKALDQPISSLLLDEAVAPFEETRVINRHFELLGL
jgi:glycosyltransferase involved in cell wall biosynthesis